MKKFSNLGGNPLFAILVAFISLEVGYVTAINYCPPGWIEYNYACLYYNPTELSFNDADTACSAVLPGAKLAAPRDAGEYAYLVSVRTDSSKDAWIGGKYDTSAYVTMAGSTWPYVLPWGSGEPSNSANGHCIALSTTNYQWKSDDCTVTKPSICMFYTHMPSISPEMFLPFNRLYGGMGLTAYRSSFHYQDGQSFNASLTQGPTGAEYTAIDLDSSLGSYISVANNTAGINYYQKNFHFMFYVYLTNSAGPIIQYRWNETNYGFNIWSNGDGSLLLDFVPASQYGPVPNTDYQVTTPTSCIPLNQWSFVTINYDYTNGGEVYLWQGTTSTTPCYQTTLGQVPVEMSAGLEVGHRNVTLPNGNRNDVFWTGKLACLISGSYAPIPLYSIGETALWCQQVLQEQLVDRTISKRRGISIAQETNLVGFWPLDNFHRGREATGRIYMGSVSNNTYAFGPHSQTNGSLIFDGLTSFASLSEYPNQAHLSAALTFIKRSFTISTYVFVKTAAEGGPLATFSYNWGRSPLTTAINVINSGVDIQVVIPKLGGYTAWVDQTFTGCLTLGNWHHLNVRYDYTAGELSVFVDGSQCGTTQSVGQEDIEAHSNIEIGRSFTLNQATPTFFKGKLSCFSVHSAVLSTTDMAAVIQTCRDVLAAGKVFSGSIYKEQHLRVFLPLGRAYGLTDLSGRAMHGTTRGRLTTTTGPLGHPYSATKLTNEPYSGIELQLTGGENPHNVGSNDSVTYMGYIAVRPNRDGNNPHHPWATIFDHWEGGMGTHFYFHTPNQIFYHFCHRSRTATTKTMTTTENMVEWHWFVVRYSRVTRKITVYIDDKQYDDTTVGWIFHNSFSSLTLGFRSGDALRNPGKFSCFMMYDTDLHEDEFRHAKDMCHAALIDAYGPPVDTRQCTHTSPGYEYSGTVSWTTSRRSCKPWLMQTDYMNDDMFPDGSRQAAGSYCRNPEPDSSVRTRPWCYTTDPAVPWEYCDIPACPQTSVYPFHKPDQLLANWPMGKLFGGSDISGHDAHAGAGGDTQWSTGPSGISSSATYFSTTMNGHYWVRHDTYHNTFDLLDIGKKAQWHPSGSSYTIFAQYTTSYNGDGTFWSWESSNGDGGTQGLQMRFQGSGIMQTYVTDYNRYGSNWISCGGLTNNVWYQFTVVHDRIVGEIRVYRDTDLCASWNYVSAGMSFFNEGLYTYSGSFKFGRLMYQSGSSISMACAAIYETTLTRNDIAVLRQKCFDTLSGVFTDYVLEPSKPVALWPMSAQTGGMNSRGPNHARFAMLEPTISAHGVAQGAFAFSGNNMQYFMAFQDYLKNLDVCSRTRSFTMSTYAYVDTIGIGMSFHTSGATYYDDNNLLGRGNQLAFLNTKSDLYFSANDGTNAFNPIKANSIPASSWSYLTISYNYQSDNFLMFVNGVYVYNQPSVRHVYCQTSGSVNMGRAAAMPVTAPVNAQPFRGSLQCAQIYENGLITESAVEKSAKYCGHPDFVGCFPAHVSGSTDFMYNPGFWESDSLTVQACRAQCGFANFQYAALRNGSVCMCGNTYGSDGPEMPEKCTVQCTGSFFGWCGGESHYSVYRSAMTRTAEAPAIKAVNYANCLPGWILRGSHCYRVFLTRKSMTAAETACQDIGASLAIIENNDENDFIANNAPSTLLAGDYICLGVNATVSGQYRGQNMNNQPGFYANWASGQPSMNNYWGCMLLSNRNWYAQNPASDKYYVCKKETGPFTDFDASTKCVSGWSRFNDKCYLFINQLMPYQVAKQACNNYVPTASLLKITNQAQYDFVLNITDLQRPVWLGLQFSESDNDFKWAVDNSLLGATNFSRWAGDERLETSMRQCVYADARSQYYWRSAECDGTKRFAYVCHYDLSSSTTTTLGLASGRVLDLQMSDVGANDTGTGAKYARLGTDSAWCVDASLVPDASLVIDLRDTYDLTEMWMQGNPNAAEWTTEATLEYSTNSGANWTTYSYTTATYYNGSLITLSPASATTLIPMNGDSSTIYKFIFDSSIAANKLRITPTQFSTRPCLRLDFYGSFADVTQQQMVIDTAFKPVHFELSYTSGASVRYNASAYIKKDRRRSTQVGVTERVTGTHYVYRPRTFGWQKVVFSGIDAEGSAHELSYEMTTGRRVQKIELNMCPIAVLYGTYAACEVRVVGGTDYDVATDYGFESFPAKRITPKKIDVGRTEPMIPSQSTTIDAENFVYIMPNQLVQNNATVYAIEAVVLSAGYITIQLYEPACQVSGTYFCPICHCCLNATLACNDEHPFDSYTCFSGYGKDPYAKCSEYGSDMHQTRIGYFTYVNPRVDYRFITEWRKYFPEAGEQIVYLEDDEVREVTLGNVIAYYRSPSDSGRLKVHSSTAVKQYSFLDSAGGFSARLTNGYILPRQIAIVSSTMHMVKLITVSSTGISFGRKWGSVSEGPQTITISVGDRLYPDNNLTYSYILEVQYKCEGHLPIFQAISDAATLVPFTVPPHNGTKCSYELDFGDETTPIYFDYTTRNLTYYHVYRLFGDYNVTLTAWNLVYRMSVAVPITIVFPIEKMSMYMANPPVTEVKHYTTAVLTFAQASNTYSLFDMDVNGTSGATASRQFDPCPGGWQSGVSDIGVDACYKFFYSLKYTYEHAEHYCASYGGTLVYGTSTEEWDFVKTVMTSSGGPTDIGAWTGYAQAKDGFQYWVSQQNKQAMPPPFWQEISGTYPQPNAGPCAYYDYASRRLQNDNCSSPRPFICKREASISTYCGPSDGWKYDPETNRCFRIFTALSPYLTAITECRRIGGQVAVPESNATLQFLLKMAQKANPVISYYIGMWRPDGATWKLYDGWQDYVPPFDNFPASPPTPGQGENCLVIEGSTGLYKIVTCSDMDGYFCEKPIYGMKGTRYAIRTPSRRYIYPLTPSPSCPLGWQLYNETGICYRLFKETLKTWNDAESDCVNHGAHLATANTADEQAFLANNVINTVGLDVWIGMAEIATDGNWLWRDGTDASTGTKPWAGSYPVSGSLGYVYYMANTQYWYEGTGAETKSYVCSKQAVRGVKKWAGSCPSGYQEFNGRCFKFVASALAQSAAVVACKAEGGGLASIRTEEDIRFARGLLPMTTDQAYVGIENSGSGWAWAADVREQSHPLFYSDMWAASQPGAATGCGMFSRADKLLITPVACTTSLPYICEQPAAVCPPLWSIWAGSCYRSFDANLHIQPGTDYDTARVACQIEDSLPISPVNQDELNFAISLAGAGQTFGFGYRRMSSSMGFIDLWGRPSFFAGQAGEPTSNSYYAYYTGSAVNYTQDIWTDKSVCQTPNKIDPDICVKKCLTQTEFDCKTIQYDGVSCEFSSLDPADDYYGLRESYAHIDLFSMRQDLCSGDMLASSLLLKHSADPTDHLNVTDIHLADGVDGFVPVDGNDTLTVEFSNTIWLNGLVIAKHGNADEWIKTFKLVYTFDRGSYLYYQHPAGVEMTFQANTVDEPVTFVELPSSVLVKAITIVPLTWESSPSFRLKVVGCGGAVFTDYAERKYPGTADYHISVESVSPRNNVSAGPMKVHVQSFLTELTLPSVPALPIGEWATLDFTYRESEPYGFPVANSTFNGMSSKNVSILPTLKRGSVIISPNMYGSVGFFPANLTIDNLLSDPLHGDLILWVDYPVQNLRITTNATATHGCLQNQTIQVFVTMDNCTRCNLTISYGAMDATPTSYFNTYDFVLENTALIDIPMVSYPSLGGFYIIAYANNYLPFVKTFVYDIYVQLLPIPTTFTYLSTTPNKIPYQSSAMVQFTYEFTGYVFYWPTNASMFIDFKDNTNITQAFDNTLMPPYHIQPYVTDLVMGRINHLYYKYGTYTADMIVFNRVGEITGNSTFDVDEDIVGLKLTPDKRYISPGDSVTFNVTWDWGSRFDWQMIVPNPDNTTDYSSVYYWNTTEITWTFYQIGMYLPSISATNLVANYSPNALLPCCPIVVQYIVRPDGYRLTALPPAGKLIFDSPEDETGHANTKFLLWINTAVQAPSSPYYMFYPGDNSQTPNASLACNPALADTTDGPWVVCMEFPYTYNNATYYEPSIDISNLASSENFMTTYTVYVAVTNLQLGVRYTENVTHPDWVFGFPRIDPVLGPKPYSQAFFPAGLPLRITATAKLGEGLRYCFFTSIEGNITDCSGPWTNTPNSVIRTFDYDTPCLSRLENCGLTLYVVASNPVDTATTSITVYLQKPSIALELLEYGPASENTSFPLWLKFQQFATDGCVVMNYGTDKLAALAPQMQLFGSEYMCADTYDQEIMKSLKPISAAQIAEKVISVAAEYYKNGNYYVSVLVRNFVSVISKNDYPEKLEKKIKVTRGPCSYPRVFIQAPTENYKKDELKIGTGVLMNCSSSLLIGFNWTIEYRASATDPWTDVTIVYIPKRSERRQRFNGVYNMTSPLDKSIKFNGTVLPYGFYRFSVWSSMLEEDELTNTVTHELEIIKSPLVVKLTPPGGRRELVFRDPIEVNGYKKSYDPDIGGVEGSKDGMNVYYFCKRDCEGGWPDFTSMTDVQSFIANPSSYPHTWKKCQTDDADLKADGFEVNGCFVSSYHLRRGDDPNLTWGFPGLNPDKFTRMVPKVLCGENATTDCEIELSHIKDDKTLSIDSSYQFENQTYNVMVLVTKDTRWAIKRQSYRLERGSAPQALITVVTNCIYPHDDIVMYNPTSRGSFHGLITDRIPGRRYFFDWEMIRVPSNKKVGDLFEELDESIELYSWPHEEWLNKTSTGREVDDLSMNANLFGPNDYGSNFIVYVGVVRSGNPRRGISSLAFYVNTPPDSSNVTCTSNEATGVAMYTGFLFECTGFVTPSPPLSKFVFSMQTCSWCPLVVQTPTLPTAAITTGLKLPPGIPEEDYLITMYLDATDRYDSITRVKFTIRVVPQVDLADVIRMAKTYEDSVKLMKPDDICQNMYTFSALVNEVILEPVYAYNETAYDIMTDKQKEQERKLVKDDEDRYQEEFRKLRKIRYGITKNLFYGIKTKGLDHDANAVRTCCGAVANVVNDPDQAAKAKTINKGIEVMKELSLILDGLSKQPTRDADRMDDATSACIGAAGKLSAAAETNMEKIKDRDKKKKEEDKENNRDGEKNDNSGKGEHGSNNNNKMPVDHFGFDDDDSTEARKRREAAAAEEEDDDGTEAEFGTIKESQSRADDMDGFLNILNVLVLDGKVLQEASSSIVGTDMASNLEKRYIGDLDNAVIKTGGPNDCGHFKITDATAVLGAADPMQGKVELAADALPPEERLKFVDLRVMAAQQKGNPFKYDDEDEDLDGEVTGLRFVNSSGHEIVVKDLKVEIEMLLESKDPQTPDATRLRSLTPPHPRKLKSMVLNVTAFSAMFLSVKQWELPNPCDGPIADNPFNLSCPTYGNETTMLWDYQNTTVSSMNITDQEVIFFVYVKFNDTPSEENFDMACTLPRMAFENEYTQATGRPWGDQNGSNATNTTLSVNTTPVPTTQPPTTTMAPPTTTAASLLNAPECADGTWNVTCCNGTVLLDGTCIGQYVLPTTPAPTILPSMGRITKNCSLPQTPDPNTCFFDHRVVNVTKGSKLFKVGIRAVPIAVVRAYLQQWAATTADDSPKEALNASRENLKSEAVRVGYIYNSFATSCKFFVKENRTWSSAGCRVGELSNPGGNPSLTQCFCNHLTSFASSFDVPMNTFDPNDSAFNKLDENPICFAFGICVFCCFFVFLIWARKKDKEDEKRWGTIPLADNDPRDRYAYEMTVWTGNRSDAGTTARVSFILLGDEGETPVHMLEDDERDVLQRGSIDSFLLLTSRSLGKLVQLRIWHDNSGKSPNWYMARMLVHDLQRNRQYYFLVDRWLAIDEDDGMVERIVPVAGKKELAGFEHLFFTKSRRKLTDGHIWVSVLARPPLSKFTRCQRLTCCISVLYCTMVANIMFFGQTSDPPGTVQVNFGPLSLSLTKIFMSVISALIVVPINLVIIQLFRLSKHRPTKQERKLEELRAKALKADEAERRRRLARGLSAPPEQVGVTTLSENVTPQEKKMTKKELRKLQKAKKKKPFKLPWWCIIIAYVLAFCTCGVAFWAIVEFGGALGPEKAEQWLASMMISLVTDILFLQPAKILALALFYALIIKSPTKDEDMEEMAALKDDEVFMHGTPTEEEMAERKKRHDDDKKDYVFMPPDPEELKVQRDLRMKEQKMWKIIKEIAFYVSFLYLLLMVAFSMTDDWSMQLQKQMRLVYHKGVLASLPYNPANPAEVQAYKPFLDRHDERFGSIESADHFFTYLERTLIPSVLDHTWYNGAYNSETDIYTKDQALLLVGSIRIRQVRIKSDACRIPKGMRDVYTEKCLAPYSIFDEETRNFTLGWEIAPLSNSTTDEDGKYITEGDPRGFAYTSEIDDRGLPLSGSLATYNGGGYIVDLGRKVGPAVKIAQFLRQHRWIDAQTRAVFVEFNLYCPSRNLFAISQSIVEFFSGGSVIPYPYFYVTRVDAYYGSFALVLLAFQIICMAIVLGLFVREIKLAIKYKRAYWGDFWAVLEFTHLLSCLIAGIMFLLRFLMARFVIGDNFADSRKYGYTNFTIFLTYDEMCLVFMGFVVFVAFIKIIRLLRFNRRLVIMINTLQHGRSMMFSFFVVFFVVYIGFAQMGYLAFSAKAKSYASFISSLEALFSMLLNKFDYKEMEDASGVVGPVFFLLFALFVNIFLINAFIAMLMFAYEEVRSNDSKLGNEHEMMNFIMNKFKAFLGLAPKRPNNLSIDKRFKYLDAAMHEDEVDKFTSRMDDLMTKLDQHLEKTKTQFSAMFDQSYLQRKQREIYTTD